MEGTRTEFQDGSVIFDEDTDSDHAFIVEEGEVQISKVIGGRPKALAVLQTGELFGEMGVIDGKPRSASAAARGKCVVTAIRGDHFLRRINSDPAFAASVMGKLVERLRHTTALVEADLESRRDPANALYDGDNWDPTGDAEEDGQEAPDPWHEALFDEENPSAVEQPRPDKGAVPLGVDLTRDPTAGPSDEPPAEARRQAVCGPQRTAPPPDRSARGGPSAGESAAGPGAQSVAAKPMPFLVPPFPGDRKGEARERFIAALAGLAPLQPIAPRTSVLPEGEWTHSARLGGPFVQLRKTLIAGRLQLGLAVRADEAGYRIQFVSPWPDDEARVGGFSILDQFTLPAEPDQPQRDFLSCAVIAANQTYEPEALKAFRGRMPPDFVSIRQAGCVQERDLPAETRARQLSVLGTVLARLAVATGDGPRFNDALRAYEAAADLLHDIESDQIRPVVLLHLAILLNTLGEREDNQSHLDRAATTCRQAAELFDKDMAPNQYVTAWARLGAILYRRSMRTGDIEICKQGLQAFKTALAGCDRKKMAEPWADVMNGLGQMLILMGKLSRNTEFITWAIHVCRNATEVRSREGNPVGWARTTNNLGTALYLLAKAESDETGFGQAMEQFDEAEGVFAAHQNAAMAETCKRNRLLVENYRDRLKNRGAPPFEWWREETPRH